METNVSDTPETDATTHLMQQAPNQLRAVVDAEVAEKLERERNEALRGWSDAGIEYACNLMDLEELREKIRLTIIENLHLADGDDCTLKRLKDAIDFDLDSLENV